MQIRKRFLAVAMTGALAGAGLVGGTAGAAGAAAQGDVGAQSCYGNAWNYSKPSGAYLQPQSTTYFTTGNCADINIKTNTSRRVRVCFYSSSGGLNYCQSAYKTTTAGQWKVIASDVLDGTHFKFEFASSAVSTGQRAH
ncbi:hypothetical protein YW5DRAFT_00418 [Streptomyces sp. Ncost-T6T-1]|uniref:hypothetical protein n=1 Tax=Streptomyces sp. Ncost-T6T-1 TaxID=1100828 RepID=UPI000805B086|nr:hypothetical protein [Streptomyces sp. Ncost-T6T-1]SBU88990.1 hypothetical protein YW5DRAFT_00418 [Streptomyces sp. Ncost-T6T-1]